MGERSEAIKEVGKEALKSLGKVIGYVYIAPTIYREHYDAPEYAHPFMSMTLSSIYSGLIHCFGAFLSDGLGKENLAKLTLINGGLSITTNVASGIYEYLRGLYIEKKKIIARKPSSSTSTPPTPTHSPSLEEKVEEKSLEEKVEDRSVRNIPNPWDIDIPKIENISSGEYHGR